MTPPEFTITANDQRLLLHFAKLPTALRTNLRETITALTDALLTQVRAAEPSRTGLLRSLTRSSVDDGETFIRGRVRVVGTAGQSHNVAAAALEYGAHRSFAVRAYQRQSIQVRAYQRQADIQAQRFLRGPAEAIRPRAIEELQAAVDRSIEETAA